MKLNESLLVFVVDVCYNRADQSVVEYDHHFGNRSPDFQHYHHYLDYDVPHYHYRRHHNHRH